MGLYELFFTSSISDSLRTATIAGARHRSGRPRIRPGRLRHKSAHGTAPALTIAPDRVPCIHPNVGRGVALRFARPAQMSLPEMPRGATPREARLAFLAQPLRTLRDHCFTHILLVPDYRCHPNTPNRKMAEGARTYAGYEVVARGGSGSPASRPRAMPAARSDPLLVLSRV